MVSDYGLGHLVVQPGAGYYQLSECSGPSANTTMTMLSIGFTLKVGVPKYYHSDGING